MEQQKRQILTEADRAAASYEEQELKFGQFLLSNKDITQTQYNHGVDLFKRLRRKLGETLCALGYITSETLYRRFAEFNETIDQVTPEDLVGYELDPEFTTQALKTPVIRVCHKTRPPLILAIKPDLALNTYRARYVDSKVCYAKLSVITNLFLDGWLRKAKDRLMSYFSTIQPTSLPEKQVAPTDFLNGLMVFALCSRASDIHIEPESENARIRIRTDGVLWPIAPFDVKYLQRVFAVVRERCETPGNEDSSAPIDGQFTFQLGFVSIDVRASTIPSIKAPGCPSIVLRLLSHSNDVPNLTELGLAEKQVKTWRSWLQNYSGVVIVSGPTGSGKSTTIYSALTEMISPEVNIVTVEDPVERMLDGAKQVQVSVKVSFAEALRAFMRHDPDIIVVGEIRDAESAKAAFQASLTGHLVISTLHASSTLGIIPRLIDFDIDRILLVECLKGLVSQRLVRKVCQKCLAERPINDLYRSLFPELSFEKYGTGCEKCGSTGFKGRTTIAEVLPARDLDARLIVDPLRHEELRKQLKEKGIMTLLEHATSKVRDGLTTTQEVFRVF